MRYGSWWRRDGRSWSGLEAARTREGIVERWNVFEMSLRIQKHCGEGLEQFELVIVGLERVSGR